MASLKEKKCIPCQGGVPPLPASDCKKFLAQLHSHWHLSRESDRLYCSLLLPDGTDIASIVENIGNLAEEENHHPELQWGKGFINIQLWTHKIGALVESDFIFAAKVDEILATRIQNKGHDDGQLPKLSGRWTLNAMNHSVFTRASFANFKIPFELILKIESLRIDCQCQIEVELGYGHMGIKLQGGDWSKLASLTEKIDQFFPTP